MNNIPSCNRRTFLKTAAAIPAIMANALPAAASQTEEVLQTAQGPLPKRKLGKNGPEVTILNLGGMMSAHNPQYLDIAWDMGIRYFDTADCYKRGQSERDIAAWIARHPERRKDLFLVTKDHPQKGPEQLLEMIDRRLEACGTKYIDLFFIHGIGTREYGEESLLWPKSESWKRAFAQIKDSGKAKLCGFSCHDAKLLDYLHAAAEGGFCDAIMLQYNPLHKKGDEFDRAVQACHDRGIGLIAMKTMRPFAKAPKQHPKLESSGLTTQQTLLQAVWSDERIASLCSSIDNVQIMEENCLAARRYAKPLPRSTFDTLDEIAAITVTPMCPGCPSCREWSLKTEYAFQDVARIVSYYELEGNCEARSYYRALSQHERTPDIDLAVLRDACQFKVDYPEIARRAEYYFS